MYKSLKSSGLEIEVAVRGTGAVLESQGVASGQKWIDATLPAHGLDSRPYLCLNWHHSYENPGPSGPQ